MNAHCLLALVIEFWTSTLLPVALPVAIALIGAGTSIWIAVSAARSRRTELNDDRAEREQLRKEEQARRLYEDRRNAVDEVIDAVIEFSDVVDDLRKRAEKNPKIDSDDTPRPNDFRLVGAVSRLATRGQARGVSMAANKVLASARWGHLFNAPRYLGPMQTVLEMWLLGELSDESAIAKLDEISAQAMARAEHEERERREQW